MRGRHLATLLTLVSPLVAFAQSNLVFFVSNVTSAPAPNGSYNDGTFIHGVNKFTCDFIYTMIDPTDNWTEAGVRAVTSAGTRWFYSPNDPNALPTAPGTSGTNRFSTFVNNPASQFDNTRFSARTSFAGSYSGPPFPIYTATLFDVAWLESPPVSTSLDTGAAVLRLTLDTSGTPFNHVRISPLLAQFGGDPAIPPPHPSAGETTLATIQVATATTHNGGTLTYCDFYIYGTPEPASEMACLAGALFVIAARRGQRG